MLSCKSFIITLFSNCKSLSWECLMFWDCSKAFESIHSYSWAKVTCFRWSCTSSVRSPSTSRPSRIRVPTSATTKTTTATEWTTRTTTTDSTGVLKCSHLTHSRSSIRLSEGCWWYIREREIEREREPEKDSEEFVNYRISSHSTFPRPANSGRSGHYDCSVLECNRVLLPFLRTVYICHPLTIISLISDSLRMLLLD